MRRRSCPCCWARSTLSTSSVQSAPSPDAGCRGGLMRRSTWLPPACAIVLGLGAVVVAGLATPAQLERMRTGCGAALCVDSLERPSDVLLDQLAAVGIT